MNARGKFGKHEISVRVAFGYASGITLTWRAREKRKAESNSYASAFITPYTHAKHEPILNSRVLLSF